MVRRGVHTRLLAALLTLWVAFAGGLAAVRPCPVHDGAPIGMPPMHGMKLPGAPPERDAHHRHDPGQPPAHGHGGHGCTCIGTCCTAATLLPPEAIDVGFVETFTPVAAILPSPRAGVAPTVVEHARPPSIGPPALPA